MRVWDVGEEIVPHADEWTWVKWGCLRGGSDDGLKDETGRETTLDEDYPSASSDIVALENAIVRGQEANDRSNTTHNNSNNNNNNNNTSSAKNTSAMAAASQERARRALRALRPEILRQAGVCPAWRTGRVTAVLDRSGTADPLNHRAVAMGPAPRRAKNATADPLIEVRAVFGTWRVAGGECRPGLSPPW